MFAKAPSDILLDMRSTIYHDKTSHFHLAMFREKSYTTSSLWAIKNDSCSVFMAKTERTTESQTKWENKDLKACHDKKRLYRAVYAYFHLPMLEENSGIMLAIFGRNQKYTDIANKKV